jgi:nucleolar protein 53
MTPTMKSKVSAVGAPAQFKQATRKGKKAWRKNIDIQPEEAAMEDARMEERVTGYVEVSNN